MNDGRGGGWGRRPSRGEDGTHSLQGLTLDIYKNKTRRLTRENKTSLNSISDLVHFSSENKSTIFDEIGFSVLYMCQKV